MISSTQKILENILMKERITNCAKVIRSDDRYHFSEEYIFDEYGNIQINWWLFREFRITKLSQSGMFEYSEKIHEPILLLASENGATIEDLEKFVKENINMEQEEKEEKEEKIIDFFEICFFIIMISCAIVFTTNIPLVKMMFAIIELLTYIIFHIVRKHKDKIVNKVNKKEKKENDNI